VDRLLLTLAIVLVAAAAALVLRHRRGPDAPTQPRYQTPSQLDRTDFPHAEAPWLLVAFTSSTCHTCADVVAKASVVDSPSVRFVEVEYGAERALHQRYHIDAVPTLVLVDRDGVVRSAHLGRVTATDLWAAVAEARAPGSVGHSECQGHATGSGDA
jgi:hypothetical protein